MRRRRPKARNKVTLASTPILGSQRLGEILVSMGVVSEASVDAALELQLEKGGRIGELLLDMDRAGEKFRAFRLAITDRLVDKERQFRLKQRCGG